MKPPFSLISFLLISASLLISLAFIGWFNLSPPSSPEFYCGVVDELKWCGNSFLKTQIKESMDSLTYQKYLAGEQLFKEAGCPSCHSLERKKVGPALRGISQRRDSIWIKKAILNFDKLIAQNDSQAIQVFNEYGNMQMPHHEFLGNKDLEKIIFYLDKGRDY